MSPRTIVRRQQLWTAKSFRSSTLVNLAAVCVRLGRKLNFKADASGFIDDDQANHLHSPALRGTWSI